jgi:hypothetical protein
MIEQHEKWCACRECMEVKMRGRKEGETNGLQRQEARQERKEG